MIKNCTCINETQDKMYGKGRRVMNQTKDSSKVRCTICGNLHSISSSEVKKIKEEKE